MNVNKLKALLPTSCECEIANADGTSEKVTINLKLNRFSFKTATQDEFRKALEAADQDPSVIGKLLSDLIAEWDIYEDDANTQMLPITLQNIVEMPVDFVVSLSNAVVGKLFPNPQKAATSANGSEAAERSINAQTTSSDGTDSQSLAASGE